MSDPSRAARLSIEAQEELLKAPPVATAATSPPGGEAAAPTRPAVVLRPWLLTTEELCSYWRFSDRCADLIGRRISADELTQLGLPDPRTLAAPNGAAAVVGSNAGAAGIDATAAPAASAALPAVGVALATPALVAQYGRTSRSSVVRQLRLLTGRQFTLIRRNKPMLLARYVNSTLMAVILSTMFLGLSPERGASRFGLVIFGAMYLGYTNGAEVPQAFYSRPIAYRHTLASCYSELAYVTSMVLAALPVSMTVCLVYVALLYWITGFAANVTYFLTLTLAMMGIDQLIAALFRGFAYLTPTMEWASALATGVYALWLMSSGYFSLVGGSFAVWLSWLRFVSPYYWLMTVVANTELQSSAYDAIDASGQTLRQEFLGLYSFIDSNVAKWLGICYMFLLALTFSIAVTTLALVLFRYDSNPGAQRRAYVLPQGMEFRTSGLVPVAGGGSEVEYDGEPHRMKVSPRMDPPAAALGDVGGGAGTGGAASRNTILAMRASAQVEVVQLERHLSIRTGQGATTISVRSLAVSPPARQVRQVTASPAVPLPPTAVATAAAAAAASDDDRPAPAVQPNFLAFDPVTTAHRLQPILQFPQVVFAFDSICYDVPKPGASPPEQLRLLRNVHGYFAPHTLTALMGASGAGKTTLLDCLGLRKNVGCLTGTIRLNGQPADKILLANCVAFVEQDDIVIPTTTVQEAVMFSSRLRYTKPITYEERAQYVIGLLHLLDLYELRGRMAGQLARGELKRLCVAIEIASAPSVLLLDEPTSALDARSAAVMMQVMRRVAATGRAVAAVIHQPNASTFLAFDQLLLLAPGGYQVFFGPLGHHGRTFTSFLARAPGVPPLAPSRNIADWMFDPFSRAVDPAAAAATATALAEFYQASSECAANRRRVQRALGSADGMPPAQAPLAVTVIGAGAAAIDDANQASSPPSSGASHQHADLEPPSPSTLEPLKYTGMHAAPFYKQLWLVFQRTNKDLWRNTDTSGARFWTLLYMAVIMGLIYVGLEAVDYAGTRSTIGFLLSASIFGGTIFFYTILVASFERRR